MTDLKSALESITAIDCFSLREIERSDGLSSLFEAYEVLAATTNSVVKFTLLDTISSWIEVTLIADGEIIKILQYWDMLAPRAEELISRRLEERCGSPPPSELAAHLAKRLRGSAARRGRGRGEQHQFYEQILENLSRRTTNLQLRCQCCGYHFRRRDLNDGQLRVADRLGLAFAETIHPGRNEDPLKPIQTQNRLQEQLTKLTIDHVTPELRLGWTYPDNLECLCAFCNQAKLAYRRPLETVSIFCAGALSNLSANNPAVGVRSTIMVSIIRANGHTCYRCGHGWHETELTVHQDLDGTVAFSPLSMRSICYDCYLTL